MRGEGMGWVGARSMLYRVRVCAYTYTCLCVSKGVYV